MAAKRFFLLFSIMAVAALLVVGGWVASSRIESPADLAARTAPPIPSPIFVPVEERVLSSNVITRGTARFGLPQPISIVPSVLKSNTGLIATLPKPMTQFKEGDIILTASGRPVFILQGQHPTYRDLSPGVSGDDVRQLEQGLDRLGFEPGSVDGIYDEKTSEAVSRWYNSKGWNAFGPTKNQIAHVRTLKQKWADARKQKMATATAAVSTALAVDAARATAERNNRAAATELAVRKAEQQRLLATPQNKTNAVETARITAEHNNRAAAVEVQAQMASRAMIVLDPRQPETARKTADAKLELARAAARRTQMEGVAAIQAAERNVKMVDEQLALVAEQLELAETAVKSVQLEGEMAIKSANDAMQIAKFDARLAAENANRLADDLAIAQSKLGVQVPADEIVFIPALPVGVKEITAHVGDQATGTVLSVTDNQLVIDSSLPLDVSALVKPGMPVVIDEQALGVKATGVVENIAHTPGTHGVDGYHIYFKVRVDETPIRLDGYSLRLTIPVKSTGKAVIAVPTSALSLTSDGTSRVKVKINNGLEYVIVEPGLSADGYVEVTPINGSLTPGQFVVVGYKNPDNKALK